MTIDVFRLAAHKSPLRQGYLRAGEYIRRYPDANVSADTITYLTLRTE